MIYTLCAHIQLDKVREMEQRFRALLVETQRGEYTRSAFIESYQPMLVELEIRLLREALSEVAEQLRD